MPSATRSPTTADGTDASVAPPLIGRWLGAAIEAGVVALVSLAPWGFGGTPPRVESYLALGVAALGLLWGVRSVVERRLRWRRCAVVAWLAALVVLTGCQLVPVPRPLLIRLSPSTANLYQRLLPSQPEVVVAGQPEEPIQPPAGTTLSLAPSLTRREWYRYTAVLLLFGLVRANIPARAGLRRLSLAMTLNGAALALFGIVQMFAAPPRTLYWLYPVRSHPFGPFVNHNHFAFYINICIGLGVGYLLWWLGGRSAASHGVDGVMRARPIPLRTSDPARLLHATAATSRLSLQPVALATIFALGVMIGSVALSLSRGGLLALLGGALFSLAIWLPQLRRSAAGLVVLATMGVSLALVVWLGAEPVVDRLATLQEGTDLIEARPAIWAQALAMPLRFPIWGIGAGAYHYIDWLNPLTSAFHAPELLTEHAHNDYLELWAEGGLVLLVPGLAVLFLIFRRGLSVVREQPETPGGWLALGALWAMATVALHSLTDFGLHIPACTVLVVVVAALLVGLGDGTTRTVPDRRGRSGADPGRHVPGSITWPSLLVALAAPFAGLAIGVEAWKQHQARVLRDRAAEDQSLAPATLFEERIELLRAATALAPDSPQLHSELGFAYRNLYEIRLQDLTEGPIDETATDLPAELPRRIPPPGAIDRLRRELLVPAVRHFLHFRDGAPLQSEGHLILAELTDTMASCDPRTLYLDRAKSLAESDPELWYRCGQLELDSGEADRAWQSWHRSLQLSPQRLGPILEQSVAVLGEEEALRRVLPDDPSRLLAAARLLYPQPGPQRGPILERAIRLLQERAGPLAPDDRYLLATLYREDGRPAEALAALKQAVQADPLRLRWRREHAELALAQGEIEAARDDLRVILGLSPGDRSAAQLLDRVNRKIAEGKP